MVTFSGEIVMYRRIRLLRVLFGSTRFVGVLSTKSSMRGVSEPSTMEPIRYANDLLSSLSLIKDFSSTGMPSEQVTRVWRPPPDGQMKLNLDAAMLEQGTRTGLGAVVRNQERTVLGWETINTPGSKTGSAKVVGKEILNNIQHTFRGKEARIQHNNRLSYQKKIIQCAPHRAGTPSTDRGLLTIRLNTIEDIFSKKLRSSILYKLLYKSPNPHRGPLSDKKVQNLSDENTVEVYYIDGPNSTYW